MHSEIKIFKISEGKTSIEVKLDKKNSLVESISVRRAF